MGRTSVVDAAAPGVSGRAVPGSPPAGRLPRRRWKDWRLVAGVLLVLGSAAAGAQLLAASDDTVSVWAARAALVPGTALTVDSLEAVAVRIEADTMPYLTGPVPEGYVVTTPVGAGELVPSSAVVPGADLVAAVRHVAVAVSPGSMPGVLRPGDRVDVWEAPDRLAPEEGADLVVSGVPVVGTQASDGGLGAVSGGPTVVLALDERDVGGSAVLDAVTSRLVAASAAQRVVLTLDPVSR